MILSVNTNLYREEQHLHLGNKIYGDVVQYLCVVDYQALKQRQQIFQKLNF